MKGIYKITNKITGQFYIGQSKDIKRRMMDHFSKSKKMGATSRKLFEDMQKYGRENFYYEVLEECNENELLALEKKYIQDLNPYYNIKEKEGNIEFGKNVSNGVKKWWQKLDQKTKERIIKENLTGPKLNHHVSEETREKLRKANLGKKQSRETIEKRKQSVKLYRLEHPQTNAGHRKKVIDDKGNVYESVKACGETIGADPSSVSAVLRGKRKTVKGIVVRYM